MNYKGLVPYLYWNSETYSFGKIYRKMFHIPRFLLLPFSSDHGVHPCEFKYDEMNDNVDFHLTWREIKGELLVNRISKQIFNIPHPWVSYRRKSGFELNSNRNRTFVFLPHNYTSWSIQDFKSIFEFVGTCKELPLNYQPLTFVFSHHDWLKDAHRHALFQDCETLTFGDVNSTSFVDKFYSCLIGAKFCVSLVFGSQIAYCVELGIPCSIVGNLPDYYQNLKKTFVKAHSEKLEEQLEYLRLTSLFTGLNTFISNQQKLEVIKLLGLHYSINYYVIYKKIITTLPFMVYKSLTLSFMYLLNICFNFLSNIFENKKYY